MDQLGWFPELEGIQYSKKASHSVPSLATILSPVLRTKFPVVPSRLVTQPSVLSLNEGCEIKSVTSIGCNSVAELYLKSNISDFKLTVASSKASTLALASLYKSAYAV